MNGSSKWNLIKALIVGAICGLAYTVVSELIQGGGGRSIANLVGLAVGGGVGGAFLFGLVAFIRNAFVK